MDRLSRLRTVRWRSGSPKRTSGLISRTRPARRGRREFQLLPLCRRFSERQLGERPRSQSSIDAAQELGPECAINRMS
jgi:hypothetical protein